MSIGAILRDARQRQGLTLRDLEETTKIRTHYLQALEEDNYAELPGQTYVKGFIRTYARTLGLNPQELVDAYKSTVVEPENVIKPIEPVAPPITKKAYPLQRIAVIAGLCALALITLFGMNKAWKSDKSAPPSQPASNTPAATTPNPQTSPNQTANPGVQATIQQGNTTTPVANGLSMDITFSGKCWLIIKADGQQVFNGTGMAGQTKNIQAKDKIEFPSIGSAGALQITLNGKPIPSLGNVGQVIKNKTFTINDVPQ